MKNIKDSKKYETKDFSDFVGMGSDYEGHTACFVGSNMVGQENSSDFNLGNIINKVKTVEQKAVSVAGKVASKAKGLVGGGSAAAAPAQSAASSGGGASTDTSGSSAPDTSGTAQPQPATAPTGGNTMMYLGIGAAVVAVLIVTVLVIKKKGK